MKTDEIIPMGLRLPKSVRERVLASADAERRSVNAQIIVLLERALPASTDTGAEASAPIPS